MARRGATQATRCPQAVIDLVRRFDQHRQACRQQSCSETRVRREFIDPFFEALGWDIDNEAGRAEAYKDVIHEDAIKVGGATKAPDYCFRVGGTRKLFVEAKKPAVGVADDPGPAYQLRRYAWSARLPLSIVTDFEEFAVYDCRVRPKPSDKASTARVWYFTFDQYPRRWNEIASIFSKDAILKGSFDQYVQSARRKRGTAEVDAELLKEIGAWRKTLASHLALRNRGLSVRELNYAVAKIIDRIIFLRMCEDRGIETYAQLRDLLNGTAVYGRLVELFRRAGDRYNSGLFHFQSEKDRAEAPDELTPNLTIDDRVLKDIIRTLYYPESPYAFSVLPVEILGQVHEQFLGQVIRLTKGHQARVEDKPEVKKAGGVYYTPKHIVDYIVQHTVGTLLEEGVPGVGRRGSGGTGDPPDDRRPPEDARSRSGSPGPGTGPAGRKAAERSHRRASKKGLTPGRRPPIPGPLRILDPACGSGSFLLGAYQYLLDWHLEYYSTHDPDKWTRRKNPPIYQVPTPDPRPQTPGPQSPTPAYHLSIREKKRILLDHIYGVDIDPQAVEVTKLSLLLKVLENETAETVGQTVRLFHERALPDLAGNIKCGNSLIGPDFCDGRQTDLSDAEERYRINAFDWRAEFPTIMKAGGFDAVIGNPPYLSFSGRQAVDLPENERSCYAAHYRSGGWITSHGLFVQRAVETLSGRFTAFIVPDQVGHLDGYGWVREIVIRYAGLVEVRYWGEAVFDGVITPALTFVADRAHRGQTLIRLPDNRGSSRVLCRGSQAWTASPICDLLPKLRRRAFSLGELVADPGVHTGNCSKTLILSATKAGPGCVPVLEGRHVSRYVCEPPARVLRLDYNAKSGEYFTIRARQRYTDAPFLIRQTAAYPIVGPRKHAHYFRNSLLALYRPKDGTDVRYLVGLLNSRLIRCVYCQTVHESRQKAFPQVKIRALRELPVRKLDPASRRDRERGDRMVHLVQGMLNLHEELATSRTLPDKTVVQRRIDASDRQIDQLVYELYGLADDEIAIVEEATK